MQQQISDDLRCLAGTLRDRRAFSDGEREAAEYISNRFRESTPDVVLEEFWGIESYPFLFASYLSEFLVVALMSLFWPRVAFCYGLLVFVAFTAELAGYRVFSRMLPRQRSQNVVARLLAQKPRYLFVVVAHYDSGIANPLTHSWMLPWLRPIYWMVQLCIVIVLAASLLGTDLFGTFNRSVIETALWIAVAILSAGAGFLFYVAARAEPCCGANFNASGVAAILALTRRFSESPLASADICFVASGANESYASGLRAFLKSNAVSRRNSYILNCEGVGEGTLHYLTHEGLFQRVRADAAMRNAAGSASPAAAPARMRNIPTEGSFARTHGYHALTLMGLDEQQHPIRWRDPSESGLQVDAEIVQEAVAKAEALLRKLEEELETRT